MLERDAAAPPVAYSAMVDDANTDAGAFWSTAAQDIAWIDEPQRPYAENQNGLVDWFPDATLNTAYNALDRHVDAGRGATTALAYVSAATGQEYEYSYGELLELV